MRALPHAPPFLFVDKVLSVEAGAGIRALKNVTANESFLSGHFPGDPIMPGVLILEALAQAAGLLWLAGWEEGAQPMQVGYLVEVRSMRFRRPVRPGDQILLEAEVLVARPRYTVCSVRATVGGQPVADGELMLALPRPQ